MANLLVLAVWATLFQSGQITTLAGTGQLACGDALQTKPVSISRSCARRRQGGLFVTTLSATACVIDGKTGICTTVVGTGKKAIAATAAAAKATLEQALRRGS